MVIAAFSMESVGGGFSFMVGIGAILYGFLTSGLGAALKVFARMGQLVEQNTLTLLRILERS